MSDEIKSLQASIQKTLHDFKQANDQTLAEIKAQGAADPATREKVENLLGEFKNLTSQIQEVKANNTALESAIRRAMKGEKMDAGEIKEIHLTELKSGVQNPGVVDRKFYAERKSALMSFMRRGDDRELAQLEAKAMTVDSDPAGGYLVTPDMSGRIVEFVYVTSPVRQVASVQTISSDALEGELDLDQADCGWVEERGVRDDTNSPVVGKWKIPVHEIYAQPKITQKLLDDAMMDVEAWHAKKVATRMARKENTAFVNGDGVTQPRGFLTYPSGVPQGDSNASPLWKVIEQVKSGANGAFDVSATPQTPGNALIQLVFRLKKEYRNNASWAMNKHTLGEAMKLTDEFGRYLWIPDFTGNGIGVKLLGYNVTEMEDIPDISTGSLSIVFGDFREAYQIVDRTGIRILRDPYTSKPYVKFYTTKRTGGDVVNFDALKIMAFSA